MGKNKWYFSCKITQKIYFYDYITDPNDSVANLTLKHNSFNPNITEIYSNRYLTTNLNKTSYLNQNKNQINLWNKCNLYKKSI